MPKPEEYLAIELWGRHLGSHDYYIEDQQAEAAEDNAPLDAIYKNIEKKWVCVSNLNPHHIIREQYERFRSERVVPPGGGEGGPDAPS